MIPWLRLAPYIAAALALAGGIWYVHHKGYTSGYDDGHREFLEYQAQAASVIAESLKVNAQLEVKRTQFATEVVNARKQHLDTIRARYAPSLDTGGVRLDAESYSDSGAVSEDSEPPERADAAAAERRFIEELRGCEEDRATLDALQQWVKGVSHAEP